VAHGARDACKSFSDRNVYGSLGICYVNGPSGLTTPFVLDLDRNSPVHVLDSHKLEIILSELDTIFDFAAHMKGKLEAIRRYRGLSYCGEEDLLAHYYLNFDTHANEHFIGSRSREFDFVTIGEGEWKGFVSSDVYARKQIANRTSYLWDEIIQRTCQNALDGTLLGDGGIFQGKSAIQEMAKEPRFSRRALSDHMIRAIRTFPDEPAPVMRNLSFMPSFFEGTGYVFLQLKLDDVGDYENGYRPKRRALLEIACAAAKNKFQDLKKVVGIAIDAPKFAKGNSEDFLLLECTDWPDSLRKHYEQLNEGLNFFNSPSMKARYSRITEFPTPETKGIQRIGRNAPCPCGSGKKFKKCCMEQTGPTAV
jgi:SEC-C motif